jgi:hypothetical protein
MEAMPFKKPPALPGGPTAARWALPNAKPGTALVPGFLIFG